jgi:pimeloyl-ACP methyl ester carboxylesterase
VITGADDVLIPARNSELLAEQIPGSKLHVIPKAGHGFTTEGRDEFLRVFVPFVKSHPLAA